MVRLRARSVSTLVLSSGAHGGSVFLDEIGELTPELQAALLGVLERGKLRRLGGQKDIDVDVRNLCLRPTVTYAKPSIQQRFASTYSIESRLCCWRCHR